MPEYKIWDPASQEAEVETFYGHGVEKYGEYHGGYLNFGLWDPGVGHYLAAAENLIRTMGRMLGLNADSRLLDVACGMGPQDILIHKTFGCRIDALDVTRKHVEHVARRAAENGFAEKIRPHHGSAVHLPFERDTFTHVLCVEGAEHFNTRARFLDEAMRVLKPGGVICIADYVITRPARNLYEKFVVEAARKLWHVPKENYESVESYGALMRRHGFTNVTIECVGDRTIPGYYFETRKPQNRVEQAKIRGWLVSKLSFFVDYSVYKAHKDGLLEYILVRAKTPQN